MTNHNNSLTISEAVKIWNKNNPTKYITVKPNERYTEYEILFIFSTISEDLKSKIHIQ